MTRRKIAILGGGVGSLTAAYHLTRTPELRADNDVTVYQMGWRLGGKGASGRSLVPDEGKRIEEHGLHLWFGFYDNAFSTLQEVYERRQVRADEKLVDWRDGFKPSSFTPIGEDWDGKLGYWPLLWPTNTDVPGDGALELSFAGSLSRLASINRRMVQQLWANAGDTSGGWKELLHNVEDAIVAAGYSGLLSVLEMIEDVSERVAVAGLVAHHGPLQAAIRWMRKALQRLAKRRFDDPEFRRFYCALEIGLTTLFGLLDPKYGVITDPHFDLDRLDYLDYREWLLENGADPWVVNDSSYLRALYDLPFAYEDGDIDRPVLAAGTAIRILFRMLTTYKEACFFEMQAGMGEAVVAPMYEVLRAQGVKVRFFHKVTKLELTPDKRWVGKVHLDRQVELESGDYDPLFRVDGISCWPSEPFWDQIVDGAAIKARLDAEKSSLESHWCHEKVGDEVLELGRDFDQVILGISLGAFKKLGAEPTMCDELFEHSPRFDAMARGLSLVPTQSFQLWTNEDLRGLGFASWRLGTPAMNGAPEPYSVWADCRQVLDKEQWGPGGPGGIFYFCGPWKNGLTTKPSGDSTVPAAAYAEVKANAKDWLSKYVGYMWPNAKDPANPAGLDWDALYDPRGGVGAARLDFQWIRPNVDPTECCVTSGANTAKLRLKADESGYENLFLAGAWLRTGINATCVEAATMGGMDAARAICGSPQVIVGEYFCQKPR